MADGSLLDALMSVKYQPTDNAMGAIGAGLGAGLQTPGLINPWRSAGSNLAVAGGGAIVAALAGSLGRQQMLQDNADLYSKMPQIMAAKSPEEQAALTGGDPRLQMMAGIINAQKMQRDIEMQQHIGEAVGIKAGEFPYEKQLKQLDLNTEIAKMNYGKQLENAQLGLGGPPSSVGGPVNPMDYAPATESGQPTLLGSAMASAGHPSFQSAKQLEMADKMQNDFSAETKDLHYNTNLESASNMVQAIKNGGPTAGTVAAINFAQMADPKVRNFTQALEEMKSDRSLMSRLGDEVNNLATGRGIGPGLQAEFLKRGAEAYSSSVDLYNQKYKNYMQDAAQKHLDPSLIPRIKPPVPVESIFGGFPDPSTHIQDVQAEMIKRGLLK